MLCKFIRRQCTLTRVSSACKPLSTRQRLSEDMPLVYTERGLILHMFTHGVNKSISCDKAAIGIVLSVTNKREHVYYEPLVAIGSTVDKPLDTRDSIAYRSIMEGLFIASDIKHTHVDIINDNEDVITALRLQSNSMTYNYDIPLLERCLTLAKSIPMHTWLDTRRKYNKAAVETALTAVKHNKFVYCNLQSDNSIAEGISQFIHADIIRTYRK